MNESNFHLENQFQSIISSAQSPSPSSADSSEARPTRSRSRVTSCTRSPHPSVSIDIGTLSPSTHHHIPPGQKMDVGLPQDKSVSPLSDDRVSARQTMSVTKISNDSSLNKSRKSIILVLSEYSTHNLQERLRV